tara:strand:+ start:1134 stop:2183 length:1050 start_codon:yes stop_codon:yes gene_type:complete
MLEDVNSSIIKTEESLNNLFKLAILKDINESCRILSADFYSDSLNYFPITKKNKTFSALFKREDDNAINHFYSEGFYKKFKEQKNNFKIIKNSLVLGSSPSDNYFSNLTHFFPRIFFINDKKINIVIERNLSNKFRKLIETISALRGIQISFIFIDQGFYFFENSSFPQFLSINKSIKILKYFFEKILTNVTVPEFKSKIYIRRVDTTYRKILNEADLIDKLRKQGFDIINPQHFEILEQMKIFSNADLIIAPHGSNMTNLIFCKEKTKIIEICPELGNDFEQNISQKYKKIGESLGLDYKIIQADSVDVENHSNIAKKYIHPKILKNSNYYKNMILKISEVDEILNTL